MDIRSTSFLLLALALTNSFHPARAEPTKLTAPFDCGTDELARRTGVMIGEVRIPRLPGQTHGCLTVSPGPTPTVWSFYTPATDGAILVTASATGAKVCVFVTDPSACAPQSRVTAGMTYAIGASLTDQTQSVLQEIDVTLSV